MTAPADPDALVNRVAARASVDRGVVLDVFQRHRLALTGVTTLPRPLRVLRLRIVGNRSVPPVGPFDSELIFGGGMTALVADNLRGKTSVFELLTWCLRGTPRGHLQQVVRSWLTRLDCDAVVAGRFLGFRLRVAEGRIVDATVLSAPDEVTVRDAVTAIPERGITEILRAPDDATYSAAVAALMLELLHLEPLESASANAASGKATYGWPAYFSALHLPAGGDRPLLGDDVHGGLPGRLLQVFLDLPSAALLTKIKATRDSVAGQLRLAAADVARLRELHARRSERTSRELTEARHALAALDDGPQPSAANLLEEVSALAAEAAGAEQALRQARQAYEVLSTQRLHDERALNDLRENAAASSLFHALDPVACPRCETPVSATRRAAERTHRTCAVCAQPVGGAAADPREAAAAAQEMQWRLDGSRRAEHAAQMQLRRAERAADRRRDQLKDAEHRWDMADATARAGERARRRDRVSRLEGALSVLETPDVIDPDEAPRDDLTVLDAAAALLEADIDGVGSGLFAELNQQVAALARDFGMRDVERVELDRAGRLRVFKPGSPPDWYTHQSAGERLRLRIAVVISLLRVGTGRGIATHPGLLLIDSPKAEEVQDDDAAALFGALDRLCAETPGLQIMITTTDGPLVARVLANACVIKASAPGMPLW